MKQFTFSAQVANNLLTVLQGYSKTIRLLLVMFLTLTVSASAWAEEELVYTLTPASGSNNSYTGTCDVEIDGITWNLAGNSTVQPWRIGGKSLTKVDRALYSKTPISNNISKITIQHGTASNITVHSVKLFVSTKENGTGTVISELSNSFTASSTMTFTRPDGKDWTNAYYKIVYNVTVSGNNNKYLQFTNAKFYSSGGGGSTKVDPEVTFSNGEYTVGGAALDLSTLWDSNSAGAVTYSVTNAGTTGATVNGTSFTATAAGTCTVQASQAATATHNATTATATITVTAPAGGGGDDDADTWTLVKDVNDLAAGDEIVIAASASNYALSTTQNNNNRGQAAVTKNGETITFGNDVQVLTLEAGNVSNSFAFYTGSGYLYAASSSNNHLKTEANLSDNSSWSIAITDAGVATITAQGTNTRNKLRYNSSNSIFSCYNSGQGDVSIYKKGGSGGGGSTPDPIGYTITYNTNGGDVIAATSGTALPNPLPTPTREHYTFVGWYTDEDCTQAATAGATIDADITLYAKWEATMYTVTLNPNYPAGKGTFKDKEENTVDGNLEISLPANTESQTIASLYSSISLDGYIFEGWFEAADGNANRTNTGTITQNITFYAHWKVPYTVTFNAGTGNCATESITETTANGIQLPTATLTDCGNWTFLGWAEAAIASETTTPPASSLAGGSTYKPTGNITLYAIYKRVEGGGGGEGTEATLTFDNTSKRSTWTTEQQVWTENGITLTNNKAESTNNVGDYANPARFYKSSEIIISAPGTITEIVATTTGGEYPTALKSSVGAEASANGNVVTITPTESNTTYTIQLSEGQVRLSSITVTYGGGLSTSYYHSNPDCGSTPTLTVDPASLAFGSVATDSNKELAFTLTGSNLTANAMLALSGTNASMFSVNPTSVTQSEGSINQAITVTYTPTAVGEHTATLTISSTGAESKTVALSGTGTEPAAKYTVTFNAGSGTCGTVSLTETSGGAGVTLPTANPPATCATDGWTFAGWWTASVAGTTTSPGELLTAGSNYKPASDCTLYAVYSHTEAGGGSGFYLSVTRDAITYYIGEKGSGSYLSAVTDVNSAATFNIESNQYLYYGDKTYVSSTSDNTSLTIATTTPTVTWAITEEGETITFKSNGDGGRYLAFNYNSGSPRFSSYGSTYTYALTKHTTSTTYNSNPVCVPSWSITYDFAGGTGSHCSNTSVPQGDSYTICDEAPTKEGYTFQGWSDGINTYQPNNSFTPEDDITLTAQWQINTYTVTWSNNGATTPVDYNHGDALEVPAAPAPCDGVKEFVGWTTHSGYYHATTAPDDIFTTKTTPVTATATYYAVFATPPGTGGGGGGSETNTTLDFTAQGYTNQQAINNLTKNGVTVTFAKGSNSNAPKYFTTGTAIRAYGGNTITLSSTGTITNVTFTFSNGDDGNEITTNNGDGEWNEPTWTGNTTSNIVFTIGGASGHRRIQSIAVTYTSGGGSGSYSDYTTTCQQVESIEVQSPQTEFHLTDDFTIGSGKVIATLSGGGTTDVTELATFSGYNMEVVGTYTVTVTYMGATATYNINVQPLDNAWVLTWNVSGKTNTGLGPRYVTKGSAIGTLPTPEVPAACAGKTFMGWTESNIVPSDGVGIVYITPETKPDDNTTYYAVFATVNNFCTQKPIGQITPGSKVVIVAVASLTDDGGAGKAISSRATVDTHNLQGDDVTIYDQTINTPHSTCIWTITQSGGKYIFTQDGKYLNGIIDGNYSNLKYNSTSDSWSLSDAASGMAMTYNMKSTNASTEYVEWYNGKFTIHNEVNANGAFDMQFFVTANADGNADITDYTTGCEEYTITYYGFHGGYSTSCSSDGTIVLPVNSLHTVPDCGDVVKDHTNLGREFLNVWMTQPHGGHTFWPGDTFILTQDTTLYAQWKLNTQNDFTTLPTDVEDLAGTDVYVYGGKTLTLQPGTTTINSLTLKGGIQADSTYKMPTVWVPEGATLVRNSNKIYLDLVVNAENWYPFAVPFETKNTSDIHYLHPDMKDAATYGQHFDIKTYDGARRADVGEDKAHNWVRLKRHTTAEPVSFKPGIGYIISAMAYPGKDTATIRIPMSVPNTWFKNGEQAAVGTTVRNTIAVTAHAGDAATEHQRHAGWNFVANPYLTSFVGGNIANDGGWDYINGKLIIEGSYEYTDEEVPYVTIPAYNFAYYDQVKLSEVKLSPEWSFFVQVGTGGTMNFTTAGRQQAPASIAARNAEERPVKMDVDLILSDNHSSDQTGIIICDRYTDAYEIGRDLEKLFGSAYNLSVYTLMEDNTPLAFQALAIRSSMQVIPVGYRAPEQGEYTFRLNEATSSIDLLNEQYEQLVLVDYQTGELTNLLYTDYTFYSERTQSNSRFAIYAVPRQNAPTDLPNAIGSDEEVRKVIYNDHLYILRDGNVYNGMGQKM